MSAPISPHDRAEPPTWVRASCLRLVGSIDGSHAAPLFDAFRHGYGGGGLVLEMSGVVDVDVAGIAAIRAIASAVLPSELVLLGCRSGVRRRLRGFGNPVGRDVIVINGGARNAPRARLLPRGSRAPLAGSVNVPRTPEPGAAIAGTSPKPRALTR